MYAKEVFGDKASILKLGMINPLPVSLILDFAEKVDKLVVIEELDPIIENHCRQLGLEVAGKDIFPLQGEYSQNLIAEKLGLPVPKGVKLDEQLPVRPPVMCAGCPHRGMFYTLSKNKVTVLGDIGCYTLGAVAPLSAVDMTLCMGGSISATHGFNKALGAESEGKTVAVIGDSTFMHSGMTGLANIAYNQSNSTVIILDNSITGMTGHQQNPTTGFNIKGDPAGKIDLEALCRAMGFNRVRVVDPYDLTACDQAVREELAAAEPSVIISRRPCALLKYVKHKKPLTVDKEKCVGCKSCMKIGCPAISIKNGKAAIDNTLCVGCGVCQQLCKFGSLISEEV
jgi:indolepyruvate ferredoxin oxidoreductase alpha subunit